MDIQAESPAANFFHIQSIGVNFEKKYFKEAIGQLH
jgi:hypothetical protein